jgi:hypothetical protein
VGTVSRLRGQVELRRYNVSELQLIMEYLNN